MAITIRDPWFTNEEHNFAGEVHEPDWPSHSKLLGADGKPLRYASRKIGFDLTPKTAREDK